MPWEHIGECGSAGSVSKREWMIAEVKLGVYYVKLACGPPPPGCKVGLMSHEHEGGDYVTVGLYWDPGQTEDAPWDYLARAERALQTFDDAVDWSRLAVEEEEEEEEEEDDDDDDDDEDGEDTPLDGEGPPQ
jgi:hypothetical protein